MRRKGPGLVAGITGLAVVATVVITGPVFAKGGGKGNVLVSTMIGSNEVGHPGDPSATGSAVVTLKPSSNSVCFKLTWNGLTGVTAAHIHIGATGVAGQVVVPFFGGAIPDTITMVGGCVTGVNSALIKAIHDNPSGYYTNVHDTAYPGGAIRGQLHPKKA
jgi:hypothetical protein